MMTKAKINPYYSDERKPLRIQFTSDKLTISHQAPDPNPNPNPKGLEHAARVRVRVRVGVGAALNPTP